MIPADAEARLDRHLRDYWQAERTAIVVATIPSLNGASIEKAAFEKFNSWGIGDRETNRGLLILLARDDRGVRIEVGCGLESVVTDAAAKRVLDENMIPRFKEQDFAGGVEQGVSALENLLIASNDAHAVSPRCLKGRKKAA